MAVRFEGNARRKGRRGAVPNPIGAQMHSEFESDVSANAFGAQTSLRYAPLRRPDRAKGAGKALQVLLHLELDEGVPSLGSVDQGQHARFHACRVRP